MSRDYRKLRAFTLADEGVIGIYRVTKGFPPEERFGLKAQIRRAAVSAATNIVEGSARRTTSDYVGFLNIAAASASETRYLLDVSCRLGLIRDANGARTLLEHYDVLVPTLLAAIGSLEALEAGATGAKPRAVLEPAEPGANDAQSLKPRA